MSKQNIADFWINKEFYKTKEELKKYARDFYTEDFISEYDKWVGNIKEFNDMLYRRIIDTKLDSTSWEEMSFDYFCKTVNDLIEKWIEEHDEFNPKDMLDITEQLMSGYYELQYTNIMKQRNTLTSILESIKKIVII